MLSIVVFHTASLNDFGLDLKGNELVGPIPTELGRLKGVGKLVENASVLCGFMLK